MITTRFYQDCRYAAPGHPAPLKLVITKQKVRALISLSVSVLPSQWDARRQIVVAHPQRVALNNFIQRQKLAVDGIIFRLAECGKLSGLRSSQIKDLVEAELSPSEAVTSTPHSCFLEFMNKKAGRTRDLYNTTLKRILDFCPKFANVRFEDITVRWLEQFEAHLAKTSPSKNARNINLRNLRAVFNYAIDEEVTQCYPFRRFKIRNEETRKRALPIDKLRMLFSLPVSESEQKYLDFARLSFLLCGINVIDLCHATSVVDGRLEYRRAKTGRLYSLKLEPEALAVIEKYKGVARVVNFSEGCKDYRSFYRHLGEALRAFGRRIGVAGLSTYWLRHSWATIARRIGVSKDDITLALGHGQKTVTDVYIDEDVEQIDIANRRVIDFVFGQP